MNCHILIPRSVLNEFVNDKKHYFKYEVKYDRIITGFSKTTFTEEDYYSKAMEGDLNKYIETPLKKLLDYARQLPTKNTYIIERDVLDVAKLYFKSLTARNPLYFNIVIEDGVHLQFLSNQEKHDLVVSDAMADSNLNLAENLYDFTFMVNATQTPFVIPIRGFYEYAIKGVECINVPLTPWCALILKRKGKSISESGNDSVFVIPSGHDDVILRMNGFAFVQQKNDGIGCVVSHDKSLLCQLQQIYSQ